MSEKKQIVQAAGVLGLATVLSRILGMVRDMVASRLFGAGMATDAFFAAYQIPNMLRRFFAEGALTAAFVPTFAEWREKEGEAAARELVNVCFTLLTIVMAAVTLVGILLSPAIVALMFPGFRAIPAKLELTVFLNRLMFPYLFFISLVALCMGVLNTVRHFFTPAISTVFLNLAMIGCAWLLHERLAVPVTALAIGVLLGGCLQLLLQLPVLWRKGFPLRPNFAFAHPAVRKVSLLMGPSIFGVGVYYLNITVGNILASLLPQGSVSYLYYAQRLFEFPQGIFTVSVAQAVLPTLSRQAAAGEHEELRQTLAFGLRLTLFVTVPASIGLLVCAEPLCSLLYMGGEFGGDKVSATALALFYYLFGLALVALVRVVVPAFYALKDTRTPVLVAFVAFLVNLGASLLLMGPLQHGGLALASSISALVNFALLAWLLRRKLGPFGGRGIALAGARALAAALPMALAVRFLVARTDWLLPGAKLAKALQLGGGVVTGLLVYLVAAWALRCSEVHDTLALVRRKLGR